MKQKATAAERGLNPQLPHHDNPSTPGGGASLGGEHLSANWQTTTEPLTIEDLRKTFDALSERGDARAEKTTCAPL